MVKRLKRRAPKPRLIGKEEADALLARMQGVMSDEDIAFVRSALEANQSIGDVLTSSMSEADGLERIKAALARVRRS